MVVILVDPACTAFFQCVSGVFVLSRVVGGSEMPSVLLGAAQVGIRPSQKLSIFYSKLQGTAYKYAEQEILIQEAVFGKT